MLLHHPFHWIIRVSGRERSGFSYRKNDILRGGLNRLNIIFIVTWILRLIIHLCAEYLLLFYLRTIVERFLRLLCIDKLFVVIRWTNRHSFAVEFSFLLGPVNGNWGRVIAPILAWVLHLIVVVRKNQTSGILAFWEPRIIIQ